MSGTQGRRFSPRDEVAFVVIGSGPAGGSVARELSRRGHDVLLLEQGRGWQRSELQHDELGVIFNDKYTNSPQLSPQTFRHSAEEKAERRRFLIYARAVGGSSFHYTANYWRFRPVDFVEHTKIGNVDGAAFADWPITYDEMEPYYTAVEWAIGVSGQAGADPDAGFRSRPYPLPPLPITSPGALLELGARRVGWRAVPAPMAIISQPYKGRQPCHNCGWCNGYPCEWGAKSGTNYTMIPEALATGRCELRAESYVRKIETNDRGRVTGVVYFDRDKQEVFQRAKAVVLCANGAESPRLLLLSKTNLHPDGLANASGFVGKCLMFNGGVISSGLFEHEVRGHRGAPVTRITHSPYELDPSLGLVGGGGFDFRFDLTPIVSALNIDGNPYGDLSGGAAPPWGSDYKKMLRRSFLNRVAAFGHSTSLPVETNRVDLDPELKDAWGVPALRTTFKEHPQDKKLFAWMQARGTDMLKAAGATETRQFPIEDDPGSSVHLLGTCRMGNDPKTSVVDKYHRAHDVANLFIVSGASFVTAGRGQPTLTIQTLGFRAADHLSQMAKRGEI